MDTIWLAVRGILEDIKAADLAKRLGGLAASSVYRWGEAPTESNPHGDIPLKRAIQVTLVTGDTRLMDAIAAEAGGVFIPVKQLIGCRFESERAAMRVMKESADLISDYVKSLEDGKVTISEYKEMARHASNLHLAAACIVESAREKAGL